MKHATWRDYYELTKPRVVMLIIFTAIVGMLLSVPGLPNLASLMFGTIGIGLAASSAAVVNMPTIAIDVCRVDVLFGECTDTWFRDQQGRIAPTDCAPGRPITAFQAACGGAKSVAHAV